MRPLFAIAPLAFVLALFSPSPVEWSASFDAFKAMFASSDKAGPIRHNRSPIGATTSLDH